MTRKLVDFSIHLPLKSDKNKLFVFYDKRGIVGNECT